MHKRRKNIAIIEPSDIIYEGLFNLIIKNIQNSNIHRIDGINDLQDSEYEFSLVIINPKCVENRLKEFIKLKKYHHNALWIGLVYSYIEDDVLQKFNQIFKITEPIDNLLNIINSNIDYDDKKQNKELSDREIDVLKLLTQGLSNKEIADKLFISTHTVISHRKNIVEKTGIKSLPGLTIYAISKNITSINQSFN